MFKYLCILLVMLCPTLSLAKTFTFFGVGPDTYEITLLKKSLEHALSETVELKMFNGNIPKLRAFQIMNKGQGIDIVIGGATQARVDMSLPIHFPIYKGLFGLRISLVNHNNIDILQDVTDLDELSSFIAGQFHSWSDTRILRHNGITVASGSDVEGLYLMLHKGRYDFFPRAVLEVSWNLDDHKALNLAIDPYTLIQYPKAHYYYVQQGNTELASLIQSGLEALHQNGEMDTLFNDSFGDTLRQLQLDKRKVIKMENPELPADVPLERRDLWLNYNYNTQ